MISNKGAIYVFNEFIPFYHFNVAYYIFYKSNHLPILKIHLSFQVRKEDPSVGLSGKILLFDFNR